MFGPGEYVSDVTEGVTQIEDLPKARVLRRSRNYPHRRCPRCGQRAYRVRSFQKVLHELGDWVSGQPCDIHLTYSQHHCHHCGAYFPADPSDWALPKSHYTLRVVTLAVRLVVEDGLAYRMASMAFVAGPPGVCALCHDPKLGGSRGKKERGNR